MRLALGWSMPRSARYLGLLALAACAGEDPVQVCPVGDADHTTIAEAVAAAPDGARIELCAATFSEPVVIADRSVHLAGAGAGATVLDGGGAGTVVTLRGGAVTLEGLTVRGGYAEYGGGIHAEGGAHRLVGVALEDNEATVRGGALYLAAEAVIEDSVLAGNRAGWTGGAVHVVGHAPVLRRNVIEGNAAAHEGGGLYLHQSRAVLEDNQIRGNRSEDDGGGLRIFESEPYLVRNLVTGNQAGGDGGGAKISHLPAELVDNEIVDNVADHSGGGLELDNDSSRVRGGVVAGNRASRGGGIHVMVWPWEGGVIEDVRIADNEAWRGGGIHLEDNFQPAVLRRLTLEGNRADQGGGLFSRGGHLVASNLLIAGNDAGGEGGGIFLGESEPWEPDDCPCPPLDPPTSIAFVVVHGNLADHGAALWTDAPNVTIESSIVSGHDGDTVVVEHGRAPGWRYNDTWPARFAGMANPTGGAGNLATEPGFTAADQGDFRLLASSPCVDAGNPELNDPDGSRADMGLHAGPEAP